MCYTRTLQTSTEGLAKSRNVVEAPPLGKFASEPKLIRPNG